METKKPPYADVGRAIVGKFGGATALSGMFKEIGLTVSPSTINHWVKTGDVPEPFRADLVRLAKLRNIPHTPIDYVAYLIAK